MPNQNRVTVYNMFWCKIIITNSLPSFQLLKNYLINNLICAVDFLG